jgi:hypothetical protein
MTYDKEPRDSLGKLAVRYDATRKATLYLIVGAGLAVIGIAVFFLRRQMAEAMLGVDNSAPYAWIGGALGLSGLGLAAVSVFYRGKALEVRAGGMRYVTPSDHVEVPWSEVRRLQVWQTRWFEGRRHVRTTWRMHVVSANAEFKLSETFLGLVSSVPSLIQMIELKSGVKFKHVNVSGGAARAKEAAEASLSADELIRRAGKMD